MTLRIGTVPPEAFYEYRQDVIFGAYRWDFLDGDQGTINDKVILFCLDGHTAGQIVDAGLTPSAPPAFLLDANRAAEVSAPQAVYDNRSHLIPEDLPTVDYLRRNGIRRVIAWTHGPPLGDLAVVLVAYRDAGLEVAVAPEGWFASSDQGGGPGVGPHRPRAGRTFGRGWWFRRRAWRRFGTGGHRLPPRGAGGGGSTGYSPSHGYSGYGGTGTGGYGGGGYGGHGG